MSPRSVKPSKDSNAPARVLTGPVAAFLYPLEKKYMMSVFGSIMGVPVMPIVGEISAQLESAAWKGGSRVRENRSWPETPSMTRTIFLCDAIITSSWEYPFGVYVRGLALKTSPALHV